MIKSMTGYGKAECEYQSKKIIIEVKSLNSKQIDIGLRIPSNYKEKELDLRNEINRELIRGKIDFIINVDSLDDEISGKINATVIQSYLNQITALSNELELSVPEDILATLIRMPDAMKTDRQELPEAEWKILLAGSLEALKSLDAFRLQEGQALEKDILARIEMIQEYADTLEPLEKQRIEKLRQRIRQNLTDLITPEKVDENRFEQELIYYIEKLDITEEKVRLANHCAYFLETIHSNDSNGKKLGFIVQEIGREINTIGSKANDSDMQKIVINMKDELEKIKEQINNIL